MKILPIEQNSDEWLEIRKGKLTGSKLGDIVNKRSVGRKIGFYQLIADKLAVEEEAEDVRERGHRLEDEAVLLFSSLTEKIVEKVGFCISDFNDAVAVSPDGLIKIEGVYKEAVEVKCLSSAKHIQALIEQQIPDEYYFQVLQYFIVNEDLETLYVVFYDPRITVKPIHYISVKREIIQSEVEKYKEYQLEALKEVNRIIEELAF